MSKERYHPYYLNDAEALREQMRLNDMIDSILKGAQEREKEQALERLIQSLRKLEKTAQDLAEITKALKNNQIKTT